MQEVPIYFHGPEEEIKEVDPYEEFNIDEEKVEEVDEFRTNTDEIEIDQEDTELDIDDIVERSGENLDREAEELLSLPEDSIDEIVDGVNDSLGEAKDYYTDLDGVSYVKDQYTSFDSLMGTVKAIQSIYGKICLDGLTDLDIKNPISDITFKDLLNNGMFDFANCFLAEITLEGGFDPLENYLISSGSNILSSDSMRTIDWVNDSLNDGAISLFDDDFKYTSVSSYVTPPSVTDPLNEIKRIENSMDSLNGTWYSDNSLILKNEKRTDLKVSVEKIDTISRASDSMRKVFSYSDNYTESLIVSQTYENETDFNNYPFSI